MPAERFRRQALLDAGPPAFTYTTDVLFQHVDAAGIVFFARTFDYVHDAYVAWLASVGHPLPAMLADGAVIAPLTHAEADYLAPLRFGDRVDVELVAADVAGSRVTLGWRTTSGGVVRAVAHTVHVFVDRASFRRAEVPERIARAIAAIGAGGA